MNGVWQLYGDRLEGRKRYAIGCHINTKNIFLQKTTYNLIQNKPTFQPATLVFFRAKTDGTVTMAPCSIIKWVILDISLADDQQWTQEDKTSN